MKKMLLASILCLLLISQNVFADAGDPVLTGSNQSGGLLFHKIITGSGNDESPYLYGASGKSLYFTTNGEYASPKVFIGTNGNVGVGTTAPTAKLEVVGQVKITGGTPGAGKVLTSDANGLATWQTSSGAGTVSVYRTYNGALTTSASLTTSVCGGNEYVTLYYSCNGNCDAVSAQTCTNTYLGKLAP